MANSAAEIALKFCNEAFHDPNEDAPKVGFVMDLATGVDNAVGQRNVARKALEDAASEINIVRQALRDEGMKLTAERLTAVLTIIRSGLIDSVA